MSVFRSIVGVGLAFALCAAPASTFAAAKKAEPAGNGEFDASKFMCLNYTNGMGANSTSRPAAIMAHIWVLGFLSGYYKASDKLERSDDPADIQLLDDAILDGCKNNPGASLHAVASQGLVMTVYKLPTSGGPDLPVTYTCSQHLEAKNAAAVRADLAELWAFAAVEGNKALAQPLLQIPIENKAAIVGAINRSCAASANHDKPYLDMAAAVADKVKMN